MTNYSYNTIMSFMIKKTHAHGYYRIYYYDQVLGDHLPPPPPSFPLYPISVKFNLWLNNLKHGDMMIVFV